MLSSIWRNSYRPLSLNDIDFALEKSLAKGKFMELRNVDRGFIVLEFEIF